MPIPPPMTPERRAKIAASLKRRAAERRARGESLARGPYHPHQPNAETINHLTPSGVTGPNGRSLAERSAARMDRQARAWRMLVAGNGANPYKSFTEMGKALGVSGTTAWKDCCEYATRIHQETLENIATWRAAHLARQEALIGVHLPRALGYSPSGGPLYVSKGMFEGGVFPETLTLSGATFSAPKVKK
jgi:hypothetical protein